MSIYATVIADTLSDETGDRCITVEVQYPRFVHAELMTHRVFSRNSASSRAVPVTKFLSQAREHPVQPLVWASEQKGMQGGPPLEGTELEKAQAFWNWMTTRTVADIEVYLEMCEGDEFRLHKSLINRWLEPVLWHKVIVTATDWGGFFRQRSTRYTDLAMPEIAKAADEVLIAIEMSDPMVMKEGGLHLPYTDESDWNWARSQTPLGHDLRPLLVKLSVARCARVSYLTHDGVRDPSLDLDLYNKLVSASPMHASPLEHVAFVSRENRHTAGLTCWGLPDHMDQPMRISRDLPLIGNLRGFLQQRAIVEAERGI